MTKHSKNNTASSIFSYAEYKKLDYGTKRVRDGFPSSYMTCVLNLHCSNDSAMNLCENLTPVHYV